MEVLVPSIVVVKLGSELILSPFRDHTICKGSSPLETMQTRLANLPSSIVSDPKVSGTNSGGSVRKYLKNKINWKKILVLPFNPWQMKITLHIQGC